MRVQGSGFGDSEVFLALRYTALFTPSLSVSQGLTYRRLTATICFVGPIESHILENADSGGPLDSREYGRVGLFYSF